VIDVATRHAGSERRFATPHGMECFALDRMGIDRPINFDRTEFLPVGSKPDSAAEECRSGRSEPKIIISGAEPCGYIMSEQQKGENL
jgi:hypothetical protein